MTPRYKDESRTGFRLVVATCMIIAFAASVVLFCRVGVSRGMATSKAIKHALTTCSALIGVVLTLGQAIKSFQKANDHKDVQAAPGDELAEVETNNYNFQHLWRVGTLWIVGAIAAALTVGGELVDFWNDGLDW